MTNGVNEQNKHLTVLERYQSGYQHGIDDAYIKEPEKRYINQQGKGIIDHTDAFMYGYFMGYHNTKSTIGFISEHAGDILE